MIPANTDCPVCGGHVKIDCEVCPICDMHRRARERAETERLRAEYELKRKQERRET